MYLIVKSLNLNIKMFYNYDIRQKGEKFMNDKVEKVENGTPNSFSAIKGKGHGAKGPEGKNYAEKPAIAKINHKDSKGE